MAQPITRLDSSSNSIVVLLVSFVVDLSRRQSVGSSANASRLIFFFVGTPAVWLEQGAAYGNELERHKSLWTAAELGAARK